MPKIPEAQPMVQMREAPVMRQSVNTSPGAFGAATGAALQGLGQLGQNITEELQQRRNVLDAQKAYMAASQDLQMFLHSPEDGLYNRQGVNAKGAFQSLQDKIPEIASKHTSTLSGAQRELFDKFWQQTTVHEITGVLRHERGQILNESIATAQGLAEMNVNSMRLNYGDDTALESYAEQVRAAVRSEAGLRGWGLVEQQLTEQKYLSEGFSGAFEGYFAATDYEGAEKILDKYGDMMQPKLVEKLRNDLRVKKQDREIESQSDIIVGMFPEDEAAAKKYIQENFKGEVRSGIDKFVEAQYADKRRLDDEQMSKEYYDGFVAIHGSPSRSAALAIANRTTNLELRAKLLSAVDGIHPRKVPGQGKLSDEQKEQNKAKEFVINSGVARLIKKEFDEDPSLPRTEAAVYEKFAQYGVYDVTTMKDVLDYANKGGVYDKVNKDSIRSALVNLGLGDKYKTNGDVPDELVEITAEQARAKGTPLSPRDIEETVRGALTAGVSPATFLGFNTTTESEWYKYNATNPNQTQFDVISTMDETDRSQVEAMALWMKKKSGSNDPINKDTMNPMVRSWLPGAVEEVKGAKKAQNFYSWAKRQRHIRYHNSEGALIEEIITPDKLQSEGMWDILWQAYNKGR